MGNIIYFFQRRKRGRGERVAEKINFKASRWKGHKEPLSPRERSLQCVYIKTTMKNLLIYIFPIDCFHTTYDLYLMVKSICQHRLVSKIYIIKKCLIFINIFSPSHRDSTHRYGLKLKNHTYGVKTSHKVNINKSSIPIRI